MSGPRFAFAGDRALAVRVLRYLMDRGDAPVALLTAGKDASHAEELARACPDVLRLDGAAFREPDGLDALRALDLEMVVSVHFPYLVPDDALAIPWWAWLNLHPAYLPYNRGWHTATWAMLDGTPAGATLHLMTPEVDAGPIVAQERIDVLPTDTAHSLYGRLLDLEFEVFARAWPAIAAGDRTVTEQDHTRATAHRRSDLDDDVRRIEPGDVAKIRALTTSDPAEAAFFEVGGKRYRVRIEIDEGD